MSSRTIENPGIEINEIDRSNYDKVDYSLPQAPTSLLFGFAPQGEDESFQWINSMQTLTSTYGIPSNEYERYFFNGIAEVLSRGGTCIAAKLPYSNASYQMYSYTDFSVSRELCTDMTIFDVDEDFTTIGKMYSTFNSCVDELSAYEYYVDESTSIQDFANKLVLFIQEFSNQTIVIQQLKDAVSNLSAFIDKYLTTAPFSYLNMIDTNLTSYATISNKLTGTAMHPGGISDMESLDKLLINSSSIRSNTIRIYDITRQQYGKFNQYNGCVKSADGKTIYNDCLGIIPVIVTPANALYFQGLLQIQSLNAAFDYSAYNQLSGFTTLNSTSVVQDFSNISSYVSMPFASINSLSAIGDDGHDYPSLSKLASSMFPTITYGIDGHFDKRYLKQIGVVVVKAVIDGSSGEQIDFQVVESFIGSLDKNARDEITKGSIFIDNVVNQQSQYIRLFSNVESSILENASIYAMSSQDAVSMGFYEVYCRKLISFKSSIVDPLTRMLDNASNPNTLPLDILIDAGVSNIAQLAKMRNNMTIDADAFPYVSNYEWKLDQANQDVSGWKLILNKFDMFAKSARKDCMFIADVIRPFCLDGSVKIVRKTAPANTVSKSIMPKLKFISNALNSSYSAGYCNWFYQKDCIADEYLWVPPSIKAAGVYIYCDTYFHPWSAPAGMTRGIINTAVDVAFVPNEQEGGQLYSNKWNYAMQYPIEGIVIEGHKTFQMDKTALDRINVRRLMLYLEKRIGRIARMFVYEGNTPYMRQRFVDTIRPVLEEAVSGDGVKEYAIKCDDELNTPEVIENNELRCKIGIKPVKVVDFIVLDFIIGRQSSNIAEEVLR